jgi:hypothetical protein
VAPIVIKCAWENGSPLIDSNVSVEFVLDSPFAVEDRNCDSLTTTRPVGIDDCADTDDCAAITHTIPNKIENSRRRLVKQSAIEAILSPDHRIVNNY